MSKKLPDKNFKQEPTLLDRISNIADNVEDSNQIVDTAFTTKRTIFFQILLTLRAELNYFVSGRGSNLKSIIKLF